MAKVVPSTVARHVAGATWGQPVQSQNRLAAGVYSFSTPGHGGVVAIVGVADIAPHALRAARETDRIGMYVNIGGKVCSTAQGFTRHSLDGWIAANAAWQGQAFEFWTGEEDCEYASVMLGLSDAAFAKALATDAKRMTIPAEQWLAEFGTRDYYRGVASRWQPEFLTALDRA